MRRILLLAAAFSLSGCGLFADTSLVCDGEEEIREDRSRRFKQVHGATALMTKTLFGKPEVLTVDSKTWTTYKAKYSYDSYEGNYVFDEGDFKGTHTQMILFPNNGRILLIHRKGGSVVFTADYICKKVMGLSNG